MKATATILAAGLAGAFALAALDVPAEARERSGAREVRPAKRTAVNRRVAQRPIFRNEARRPMRLRSAITPVRRRRRSLMAVPGGRSSSP